MLASKRKTYNQPPQSRVLFFLQWVVVNLRYLAIATLLFFQECIAQISKGLAKTHAALVQHGSVSSLFEFIKLSLLAHGLYPLDALLSKASSCSPGSLYSTDEELENCLEYCDLVLPSKPPPENILDPPWSSIGKSAQNFDSPSFSEPISHDRDISFSSVTDSTSNDSTVYFSNDPSNTTNSTSSASSSLDPSAPLPTLLQSKPASLKKKKGLTKASANSTSSDEPTALRKKGKHASSSSISVSAQPIQTEPQLKSPKKNSPNKIAKQAAPASSTVKAKSTPSKRDLSLVSGNSTPDSTHSSQQIASQHDQDSFVKVAKKQRQTKTGHKKKHSEVSNATASRFSKPTSGNVSPSPTENKGFKLVSKKSKRKKNSSIDKISDKLGSFSTEPKKAEVEKPVKEQAPSVRNHEAMLDNETGVLSEIMDAALLNINQLSDNEPPATLSYPSPASSVTSVKWPIDSRIFGSAAYNGISTHSPGPTCGQSWIMKPPQTNFSNTSQIPFQSQPVPFVFPPDAYSFSVSSHRQHGLRRASDAGVIPFSSADGATDSLCQSPLIVPPSMSPCISEPSIYGHRRRSTMVTSSNLMWSVPAHMSNI